MGKLASYKRKFYNFAVVGVVYGDVKALERWGHGDVTDCICFLVMLLYFIAHLLATLTIL